MLTGGGATTFLLRNMACSCLLKWFNLHNIRTRKLKAQRAQVFADRCKLVIDSNILRIGLLEQCHEPLKVHVTLRIHSVVQRSSCKLRPSADKRLSSGIVYPCARLDKLDWSIRFGLKLKISTTWKTSWETKIHPLLDATFAFFQLEMHGGIFQSFWSLEQQGTGLSKVSGASIVSPLKDEAFSKHRQLLQGHDYEVQWVLLTDSLSLYCVYFLQDWFIRHIWSTFQSQLVQHVCNRCSSMSFAVSLRGGEWWTGGGGEGGPRGTCASASLDFPIKSNCKWVK